MIERIIETKVSICDFDELNADQKMLIEKAKSQANNAYAVMEEVLNMLHKVGVLRLIALEGITR